MSSARALAIALASFMGLAGGTLSPAAQNVDLATLFGRKTPESIPSGEEILRRALDNLFGFDASISVRTDRRSTDGRIRTSEFVLMRKRTQGARRALSVSVRPDAVRGTRVLQLNYDDGREEAYAFVQSVGSEPTRARYRISDPFLGTWHEIGDAEPPREMLALVDQEVLGVEPRQVEGEAAYKVTVRPLAPRGYDHSELLIARDDYAILECREYLPRTATPALIAVSPRSAMVRFGDHLVPARMRYRDLVDNSEIEVTLRHEPLPDGSDGLFFPRTFHRIPLAVLDTPKPGPE